MPQPVAESILSYEKFRRLRGTLRFLKSLEVPHEHEWGDWQDATFADARSRPCCRCGLLQVEAKEDA